MPPLKFYQPKRLEALSSARVSRLALDSCLHIQQCFPETQHLVLAKEVHGHFSTVRPLLDDVLNQCLDTARTQPLGIQAEVLLEAMVHPTIKTLNYSYIMLSETMCRQLPEFSLYTYDIFFDNLYIGRRNLGKHLRIESRLWMKYLPQLSNLTELNLIGINIQTNSLLMKVVATSCPKLDILSIGIDNSTDLEALRHLVNIHSLRVIKSWESFHKSPFNLQDFHNNILCDPKVREVFRYLLSNLPKLEYIPIHFTGQILKELKENNAGPLALVECLECYPSQAKLQAIVDLCPNLTGLYLSGSYYHDYLDYDIDENMILIFIDLLPITDSTLQISTLVLCDLTVKLEDLIRIKGVFIRHMKLDDVRCNDHEILFLVGRHCPMLEILHISLWDHNFNTNWQKVTSAQEQKLIFQNLVDFSFTIALFEFDWEKLVSYLHDAVKLKSVTFCIKWRSSESSASLTRAMTHLLDINPLLELEQFEADKFNIESLEMVSRLTNLPKLKNICLVNCTLSREVKHYLEQMKAHNIANNLNLIVSYDSMNSSRLHLPYGT